MNAMPDFERLRLGMVDGQIRVADVTDHRLIAAFLKVERERFMPAGRRELAYLDIQTPLGRGRAMLDPMTLAKLVQLADPQPGERVLVVGAGLGYTVALFVELGAEVVGLEDEPALAAAARAALSGVGAATIVDGPLVAGAAAHGPYDLIFCEGAIVEGFDALGEQLAPEGRIVAPSGRSRPTKATIFRRNGEELGAAATFDAAAPVLPGFEAAPAFAF